MPPEEIELLKTLSSRRWERFWVHGGTIEDRCDEVQFLAWEAFEAQGGKIERRCKNEPLAYALPSILVEAGEKFMIGGASLDLPDRTEILRIGVSVRSLDDLRFATPPMQPLTTIPEDLNITDFLDQENSVRVVRIGYTELSGIKIVFDWGILFENKLGAMLVFEDEARPWGICLTTNKPVINQLLEAATASVLPDLPKAGA